MREFKFNFFLADISSIKQRSIACLNFMIFAHGVKNPKFLCKHGVSNVITEYGLEITRIKLCNKFVKFSEYAARFRAGLALSLILHPINLLLFFDNVLGSLLLHHACTLQPLLTFPHLIRQACPLIRVSYDRLGRDGFRARRSGAIYLHV